MLANEFSTWFILDFFQWKTKHEYPITPKKYETVTGRFFGKDLFLNRKHHLNCCTTPFMVRFDPITNHPHRHGFWGCLITGDGMVTVIISHYQPLLLANR